MQHSAVIFSIVVKDGAKLLSGLYFITDFDAGRGQVAIDRDVGSVPDEDVEESVELEDSCHLSMEDGTRLCARSPLKVDPLVVQFDVPQSLDRVLPVVADYEIGAGDGSRESAAVVLKASREPDLVGAHAIGGG